MDVSSSSAEPHDAVEFLEVFKVSTQDKVRSSGPWSRSLTIPVPGGERHDLHPLEVMDAGGL